MRRITGGLAAASIALAPVAVFAQEAQQTPPVPATAPEQQEAGEKPSLVENIAGAVGGLVAGSAAGASGGPLASAVAAPVGRKIGRGIGGFFRKLFGGGKKKEVEAAQQQVAAPASAETAATAAPPPAAVSAEQAAQPAAAQVPATNVLAETPADPIGDLIDESATAEPAPAQ